MHHLFVDFIVLYDSIDPTVLWNIMDENGYCINKHNTYTFDYSPSLHTPLLPELKNSPSSSPSSVSIRIAIASMTGKNMARTKSKKWWSTLFIPIVRPSPTSLSLMRTALLLPNYILEAWAAGSSVQLFLPPQSSSFHAGSVGYRRKWVLISQQQRVVVVVAADQAICKILKVICGARGTC